MKKTKTKQKQKYEKFLDETNPLGTKRLNDIIWVCTTCDELNLEQNMEMVRVCPDCKSHDVYIHGRVNEPGRYEILDSKIIKEKKTGRTIVLQLANKNALVK